MAVVVCGVGVAKGVLPGFIVFLDLNNFLVLII